MKLKEKIQLDLNNAMKAKQADVVSTLRGIKAKITEAEKGNGNIELNDAEVLKVIDKGVKERTGSINVYIQATGNVERAEELATKERNEIRILMAYLPAKMTEDEIRAAITDILAAGTYTKADMGKVMKEFSAKYSGQDGKLVSEIVKASLV